MTNRLSFQVGMVKKNEVSMYEVKTCENCIKKWRPWIQGKDIAWHLSWPPRLQSFVLGFITPPVKKELLSYIVIMFLQKLEETNGQKKPAKRW